MDHVRNACGYSSHHFAGKSKYSNHKNGNRQSSKGVKVRIDVFN